MFTFRRTESKPAEVWTIAAAEGALPDAEARFGAAARYNAREAEEEGPSNFHELGVIVAFETSAGVTEFVLACKDGLSEREKNTLFVEFEMLLGRHCYGGRGDEQKGWFVHDTLLD